VSDDLTVEATGETVGEAKWKALRELERLAPGLDKAGVRFQVLSEGERGLLGVGYTPAHVIATVAADAGTDETDEVRPDETDLERRVRELVTRVVGAMGVRCRVDVRESADDVVATCSGVELGLLIGKHGHTIDALQYLVNAIVARGAGEERKPVVVDAAGYRERRKQTVEGLAVRSAELALQTGDRVELDPMTSVERKLVHERLQDYPGVATTSEGVEPHRFVVVLPAR
jgi:spoIIIJ-associated protein